MSFDCVVGQDTAVRLLTVALRSGRIGSGYLFHGPEGVGKGLAAEAFARALLCETGGSAGDACGSCPACIRSMAESHPGLHLVRLLPTKTQILLPQVHDLTAELSLRPVEGSRQVAVITGAERMNEEAFNALLKTLEEPPPGATLVLATANREVIPETIRSRCQGVRFRPLAEEHVKRLVVEQLKRTDEEAEMLAALSGGSMARVESILGLDLLAEGAGEALAAGDPQDDSRLSEAWIRIVKEGGKSDQRGRVETLLRVLMERQRAALLAGSPTAGVETRMELLSRAIEDNRLNLSAESIFRSLAVGWVDSLAGESR